MPSQQNALPVPTLCDNCCSVNIKYTTNDEIYGRITSGWPYVYICLDCRAAVGCHPNTSIPLGRMADRDTRILRKEAHAAFDPLWQNQYMTRTKAYTWLAAELGICYADCHMSWLTKEQLIKAIRICTEYIELNIKSLQRRKAKYNAKALERNKRVANNIDRRKTKR